MLLLSGCGLQSGGETIAFISGKTLWAINPDGSGLRALAQGHIVSAAWSPDHHQYVLRYGQPPQIPSPFSPLGVPDTSGDLGVGSVSGGTIVQITPSASGLSRSDAWWNANGNRLIYRESFTGATDAGATYVVSQADQPVGIARKPLDQNAIIPVLSPDGSRVATADSKGTIFLGAPGATGNVIATGALLTLPEGVRPARLLWQPRHDALLYMQAGAGAAVALRLKTLDGATRSLGEVTGLLDLAFSPDGSRLLLRTTDGFAVWNVAQPGQPIFTWSDDDPAALPYWSPAGGRILVQDSLGWSLVDIAKRSVTSLVAYQGASPTDVADVTGWHPAAASPWNGAGDHFVFLGNAQTLWRGKEVHMPGHGAVGLYVASLSGADVPALIHSGADNAPAWSYLDPSTTFLVMA